MDGTIFFLNKTIVTYFDRAFEVYQSFRKVAEKSRSERFRKYFVSFIEVFVQGMLVL